jgi:predicted CoA-binding protein
MAKKTLVMGASTNPTRYANMATHKLLEHQHEVELLGKKKGEVAGHIIHHSTADLSEDFHTVTMYLGESNQKEYYDYLLKLAPKRVIFNPGAENEYLANTLSANGIEVLEACTLVLLATGQF